MERKIAKEVTGYFLNKKKIPKSQAGDLMCHAILTMMNVNSQFWKTMLVKMEFKGWNCGDITENLLNELFRVSNPINWNYIVQAYAVLACFTDECKVLGMERFVKHMVRKVDCHLQRPTIQTFINNNGGWDGFCEHYAKVQH